MKRLFYLAVTALLACLPLSCNQDKPGSDEDVTILCATADADEITVNSATLKGTFLISGSSSEQVEAWFLIGKDAASVSKNGTKVSAGTAPSKGGVVSAVATDLEPATTYYFMACASIDGTLASGDVLSFTTLSRPTEVIVTAEATNVTINSAVLYGYADLEKTGVSGVQFGIIVSTNENPSEANGHMWPCYEIDRNNKYFAEVSGLYSNTTYYYKAYIKVGDLLKVGEVKSFTTSNYDITVITNDASDIKPFSARINGYAQGQDVDMVNNFYFLYSETASTIEDLKTKGVSTIKAYNQADGSFYWDLKFLSSSTKYYYVAVAVINEHGDGSQELFGEVKSFTTAEITASVTTREASNVGFDTSTISGEVRSDYTLERCFLYSSTASTLEKLISDGVLKNLGSGDSSFSVTLTGLTSGTKYYYVAFAKAADGKAFYGEVKNFTTKTINASVQTLDAGDILLFSAALYGSIQINNTETLSKSVWFLYSTTASTLDALKSSGTKLSTSSISYDGVFVYVIEGLPSATKFYYVACANIAGKEFYGQVKSFSTHKESDYGEAVDLGLSVKWRSCNIGATTPEEYGNYFAWGEIEPKSKYYWDTYKWCNGSESSLTKYNTSNSYGVRDNRTVLEKDDDVAFVKLGGNWRMPTDAEWTELLENCTWISTTQNGVSGKLVTSKKNSNSVFLPAAGYWHFTSSYSVDYCYYWSSTLDKDNPSNAWAVVLYSRHEEPRDVGYSVRPVTK